MDASSKNQLRQRLRQRLRQQRRALPAAIQRRAAKRLLQQLRKLPEFRRARHIALYSASDGEISTTDVLRYCQRRGKVCYLPVIHRDTKHAQMRFHRHAPGQTLHNNAFNIPEPNALRRRQIDPIRLDMMLLPLVGFDRRGNRLGMGGGYYDRALAFKQRRNAASKPLLIGLAHHLQEVERLPTQHWDIPLDWVATDREIFAAG